MLRLGVNVDHVATLREARGVSYPDPLEAAQRCVAAGACGITIHLREDRRHIKDADVHLMRRELDVPLNLEMACVSEIVDIALDVCPAEVCLVPEKREELTTEGGLDVIAFEDAVSEVVGRFRERGITVSLFIDPDRDQLDASIRTGAEFVELHTGTFCNAVGDAARIELDRLADASRYGAGLGLKINAGHGINMENIESILEIPHMHTLNIGHSIIARAVIEGIDAAVKEMLDVMENYQED